MIEVRGSKRSSLDMGEVADRRSNAPMDMAMEMAMVVTSITTETSGKETPELIGRKENGKRRRRSEVPATTWVLGNWRSRMDCTARQQAHKLAQLHRTIAKMSNMLETHSALQKAQWRGIKLWLEEKEKMWET
jgi:hypothetical protein